MSNYVETQAAKTREFLIPAKSKTTYSKEYEGFRKWKRKSLVDGVSENILLEYFEDLLQEYSPNTLWPKLSMLRSMQHLKEKKNVKLFDEVEVFVESKNKVYVPENSAVLSWKQIKKFLIEAPNDFSDV